MNAGNKTDRVTAPARSAGSCVPAALLGDLRRMIQEARQRVAISVNSAIVTLYWDVGHRVRKDILKKKRAGYGEEIVSVPGRGLGAVFGRGVSEKSLWHMIRFAEVFSDERILSALRRQLSWTLDRTKRRHELTSMGIRVTKETLRQQCEMGNQLDFLEQPYHQAILKDEIPLSIGGGIGQSRTYMYLLRTAHLGECSVTVWPKELKEICEPRNIKVLE